jgi:hypothetical protein
MPSFVSGSIGIELTGTHLALSRNSLEKNKGSRLKFRDEIGRASELVDLSVLSIHSLHIGKNVIKSAGEYFI